MGTATVNVEEKTLIDRQTVKICVIDYLVDKIHLPLFEVNEPFDKNNTDYEMLQMALNEFTNSKNNMDKAFSAVIYYFNPLTMNKIIEENSKTPNFFLLKDLANEIIYIDIPTLEKYGKIYHMNPFDLKNYIESNVDRAVNTLYGCEQIIPKRRRFRLSDTIKRDISMDDILDEISSFYRNIID